MPDTSYMYIIKRLLRAGVPINKRRFSGDNVMTTQTQTETSRDAALTLYAAGETLGGTEEEDIPEVLKFEEEKLELKHICREAIRKHLLKLDRHSNLFGRIPQLGLPSILTEYLLLNQSLDDEEEEEEEEEEDGDDNDDDDDEDSDDDENKMFVRKYKDALEQRQKQSE